MTFSDRRHRPIQSPLHRSAPLVLLLLAGCVQPPPGERVSYVSTVGTPFYIALKIPTCVATVAIAAPLAALQGLAAPNWDRYDPDIRPALDAGIADNCGPPYILPPE